MRAKSPISKSYNVFVVRVMMLLVMGKYYFTGSERLEDEGMSISAQWERSLSDNGQVWQAAQGESCRFSVRFQ